MILRFRWLLILTAFVFLHSECSSPGRKPEIPEELKDFRTGRFEADLFAPGITFGPEHLHALRKKYGSFTDIFTSRILQIPEGTDSSAAAGLRMFITDMEVLEIKRRSDSLFADFSGEDEGLVTFLATHSMHFPEKPLPKVYTFISAFNYAVITTDSAIGIGLDMFLGPDLPQYAAIGIPKYIFSRFTPEYMLPAVIKGWFQSDYDPGEVKNEMLSQMVYHGKLLYYSRLMAPGLHDSLITGYSEAQLEWCAANESKIWSFFIENKLLFSTDPSIYVKYINEGPSTGGFPNEAPGKIGAWVGWRIVNAYMEKNEGIALETLLKNNDALAILESSGYKPRD
jgi:hypothetical protein